MGVGNLRSEFALPTAPQPTLPTRGRVAVAPACGIRNALECLCRPKSPRPPAADELPFWRRKAMKDMTPAEWESLCDGCGRCCLNKLQEEGTDRTYYTDVGCKLLDGQTCRCTDYANRSAKVKDCVTLTHAQHQPHLMAAADLRLQARGGGQGFVLVASAGLGRPGDGARGGRVGAGQGRRERGRRAGQGFGGSHRELAAEVAEGREGEVVTSGVHEDAASKAAAVESKDGQPVVK